MTRRDLIFLLNLIEFLFESDASPGIQEKIKPGEFRNALQAYLEVSNEATLNPQRSKEEKDALEKATKHIKILQEQVASLSSMTEMTINYMQEFIGRLESENKKIIGGIKFIEKFVELSNVYAKSSPFISVFLETANNQDFLISTTTSKNGIFYAVIAENPFKNILKSIFSLFVYFITEQLINNKRISSAGAFLLELENQIQLIQHRIEPSNKNKPNLGVCVIDKQLGDLEYSSNFFPLYVINKGNLLNFLPQEIIATDALSADRYNVDRVLLRESAEIYMIASKNSKVDSEISAIVQKIADLEAKSKDIIKMFESKGQSATVFSIKF